MNVLRPPGVGIVSPGISARFDSGKAIFAVGIGGGALTRRIAAAIQQSQHHVGNRLLVAIEDAVVPHAGRAAAHGAVEPARRRRRRAGPGDAPGFDPGAGGPGEPSGDPGHDRHAPREHRGKGHARGKVIITVKHNNGA